MATRLAQAAVLGLGVCIGLVWGLQPASHGGANSASARPSGDWEFDASIVSAATKTQVLAMQEKLAPLPVSPLSDTAALQSRTYESIQSAGASAAAWLPTDAASQIAGALSALSLDSEQFVAWRLGRGDVPIAYGDAQANLGVDAFEFVAGRPWNESDSVPAASASVRTFERSMTPTNRPKGFLNDASCVAARFWTSGGDYPIIQTSPSLNEDVWFCGPTLGRAWWTTPGAPSAQGAPRVTVAIIVEFDDGWRAPVHATFAPTASGKLALVQMTRYGAALQGARLEY